MVIRGTKPAKIDLISAWLVVAQPMTTILPE
jgi:hypothetical protein